MEDSKINPIFSVSDFLAVVNQTFEHAYPIVEIEGEVSSFKVNQGKYIFFDLKDTESSVNCFMMLWQMRMPVEDGMKVIVVATPKITKFGKFSLTIKSIRPSGEGSIKKSFEILKEKLDKEGLFSPERKRLLPNRPKHIGLISSINAAGYADFIKIINDRWSGITIDVANVQVQGNGAPEQIINAINYFNQQDILPEVLVIIRGGGSADDLSTFNDEPLVRTIASSRAPILIGVGHEVDESLSDLAADYSASTPSNAAQILVPDKKAVIEQSKMRIKSVVPMLLQKTSQLEQMTSKILINIIDKINYQINQKEFIIKKSKDILEQLNPDKVLSRGYAILRGKIEIGEMIEIEITDKIIKAEVKNVEGK